VRVVDLTQWYSPTSGGIRTYLRSKAAWATRHGLSHAAVVTGPRDRDEEVGASTFRHVRGRTPADRWGYRVAPRSGPVLKALERLEPDVVVLHDALAFPRSVAAWAGAHGVPVVMVCHSDLALGASGLPPLLRGAGAALLGAAQRHALRAPALVLVASEASRARVARHTRVPVVTSPLGIDLDVFTGARPDPALRERLAPPDAALLLYAGRLSSEKRVELLPPALALLERPAILAIAGAGASASRIRRVARRHGVEERLLFLGHIRDRRELAALMATADCFVHPNPTEAYGLCPLEALAAGCRVVAPDSAGCAEVLGGRGAVLVDPRAPAALAGAIDRALADARPRPAMDDLACEAAFAREWGLYAGLPAA